MAQERKTVSYNLDSGTEIKIIVSYEDTTANQRLNEGGLQTVSNSCIGVVTRRGLEPREVVHKTLGRIVFKTHDAWKNYIASNKDNINRATGEVLKCHAVQLF